MSDSNTPSAPTPRISRISAPIKRQNLKPPRLSVSREPNDDLFTSEYLISYGKITFADNKSNRAEFVRIANNTPPVLVKDLLNNHWCKGRPSFVISITGGAAGFKMQSRLSRLFRRGLLKVARTTGAWIITGGTNKGIMKIVGDLLQVNRDPSRPIHLIGIATWGCISNRSKLEVRGSNVHYSKPTSEAKNEAPLEPNHTEFILVDDKSENTYGGEIEFRARLEKAILGNFSKSRSSSSVDGEHPKLTADNPYLSETPDAVPVVLLVVEGGPNTVKTVHEAVVNNNIPAVFLEGTGRCCDLFGKACRLYKKYRAQYRLDEELLDSKTKTKNSDDLRRRIRTELDDHLRAVSGMVVVANAGADKASSKATLAAQKNKINTEELDKLFDEVYLCLDTRFHLLNVVSLNYQNSVEPDIDLAILHALLNATSDSDTSEVNFDRKRRQFLLALEWNRADIARRSIMKTNRDWEKVDLNGVLEMALLQDKIGFVELLLDHDFSLTEAFKGDKLPLLYRRALQVKTIFSGNSFHSLESIYRTIFQPLIGDFFDVKIAMGIEQAIDESRNHEIIDGELCVCCIPSCTTQHKRSEALIELSRLSDQRQPASRDYHMDVDKELFLWSVVTGKSDFTRLFWGRSKNKICAALVAVILCKRLAHKSNVSTYLQIAHEFEGLAEKVLDRYYRINPLDCKTAIVRQIPAYGNVTWLQLAIEGEVKPFIAHQAVQKVLSEIWYGDIDSSGDKLKIVLLTFLPVFSCFLHYRDKQREINEQPTSSDRPMNSVSSSEPDTRANSKQCNSKETDNTRTQLLVTSANNYKIAHSSAFSARIMRMQTEIRRYFQNIVRFTRAPCVKYLYSIYSHLIFLLLFSYVMLCDFFPLYPVNINACPYLSTSDRTPHDNAYLSVTNGTTHLDQTDPTGFEVRDRASAAEWILFFWIFNLLCEELRQFLTMEAQTFRKMCASYFNVFWNKLDMFAIALFYIGFTLRFFPPTECFCAARIILSVDVTLWFIRSLDMFIAIKRLGPKLVMIGEMATDFMYFLLLLVVFIFGFGVSTYSILYGSKDLSWHIPRRIFNLAYWQMFGDLNALETFEHVYTPNGYAAFILIVVYMLIVSILLVNLLIAMFSYKFDQLQNDTDRIWKFQRYFLVCEFLTRPTLPPPFAVLSHFRRLLLFGLAKWTKYPCLKTMLTQHSNRTTFKLTVDEEIAHVIETAEDTEGDEVYDIFMKSYPREDEHVYNHNENQSPPTREAMISRIQSLEIQQSQLMEYLGCSVNDLKAVNNDPEGMSKKHYFLSPYSIEETNDDDHHLKERDLRSSFVDDDQKSFTSDDKFSRAQTGPPS